MVDDFCVMKKNTILNLITLLFLTLPAFQKTFAQGNQTGAIYGVVIDESTGETLPGVVVTIDGTNLNASSDLDGKFKINAVPAGTYKVTFAFISYVSKVFPNIVIKQGETAALNISLATSTTDLKEVIVESEAKRESINALLIQQKNSISVSDAISAETIKKTPDKNSSDVLKRVSGTSIQDNKFAIIRGLNDRYNAAFLNGAPLPSSESDRKAFSFEIFPANLLDNITIIKSASADLPADFAGGIIQINTRNIPEENMQQLSIGASYNTISTFKSYTTYKGGKYDALGFDDGTRKMPGGLPTTAEFRAFNTTEQANAAKLISSDWSLQNKKSTPLNTNFQYTIGRNAKLFKNDLGAIFSLTYQNTFKTTQSVRKEFNEAISDEKPQQEFELNDTEYSNQVLGGALANITYKIKGNHVLSLKNMYSLNAEDKTILRNGIRDYSSENANLQKGTVRWFTQNKLFSTQLNGDHLLPASKIKIKWTAGLSDIKREIPNLRRMIYQREANADSLPYVASLANSGTSPGNGGNIFFSSTNEKIYSGNLEFTIPLKFVPFKTEIKVGAYYQQRERKFAARQFGYTKWVNNSRNTFKDSLLLLPEDSIFLPENLGTISAYVPKQGNNPAVKAVQGFKLEEATKLNDSYTASSYNKAAFAMLDSRLSKKLHVVLGVRMENYRQALQSFEDDGDSITLDTAVTDFLPSGTFIYSPGEKSNIRLSYAQTVSRPEFRELAPFGFYDFVTEYTVRGNPNIKRALVNNFDLKYELYPGMGQIVSASVFYKHFSNAIEQLNRADVPRELYFQNVANVNNYGIELEYRFNLGWLLSEQNNKFLAATTIFSNFAYIISEVHTDGIQGARASMRPLQGQSPYIINAGVQFQEPVTQFAFSAAVNQIGRRIAIVGNTSEPDIYENPRLVLDLQVSKVFYKKLEVKLNVRDLFAQDQVFYQDLNNNNKLDAGVDNEMARSKFGKVFSLGLSYRL